MDAEDHGGRLSAEEAFEVLGHETRLAILHALWNARSPERYPDVDPVSFVDLRKRVGMEDGSQFNYHLKRLVGPFVHRSEDGYVLRRAGERVLTAALSGTLTDDLVMEGVPVDDPCPLCGGDVVMDYGVEPLLDNLVVRCTGCEGAFGWEGQSGVLYVGELLPPAAVQRRSGDELHRALGVWNKHALLSMIEGVCPHCGGTCDVEPMVCPDHDAGDGRLCRSCGTVFEILFRRKCELCGVGGPLPLDRHLLANPRIAAFLADHDLDPWGAGGNWLRVHAEATESQTITAEDPLEVEVVLELGGDRLTATLDATGAVIDVSEHYLAP